MCKEIFVEICVEEHYKFSNTIFLIHVHDKQFNTVERFFYPGLIENEPFYLSWNKHNCFFEPELHVLMPSFAMNL